MSSLSSKKVIYAALIGNFLIAITKSAAEVERAVSEMGKEIKTRLPEINGFLSRHKAGRHRHPWGNP